MTAKIKHLTFTLCIQCILFNSCSNTNSTQPEVHTMTTVDWKAYLSRPHVLINVSKGSISAHPYMSSFDTATAIDSVSLGFVAQDSILLKDSSWYSCKDRVEYSCFGTPIFYRQDTSANYPHSVVLRYRINKNHFFMDTIQISPTIEFINMTTFSKATTDSSTYTYTITWNMAVLNSYYAPYITIAIDNGLFGAEYYESHPNYDNLPETPQPPEGYKTIYNRFSPGDNIFSFQSKQNHMPFIRTNYTVKRYSAFDVRVVINTAGVWLTIHAPQN